MRKTLKERIAALSHQDLLTAARATAAADVVRKESGLLELVDDRSEVLRIMAERLPALARALHEESSIASQRIPPLGILASADTVDRSWAQNEDAPVSSATWRTLLATVDPRRVLLRPELLYSAARTSSTAVGLARPGERVPITTIKANAPTAVVLRVEGIPSGWHHGVVLLLRLTDAPEFEFLLPRIIPPLKKAPPLDLSTHIDHGRFEATFTLMLTPGAYSLLVLVARSPEFLAGLEDAARRELPAAMAYELLARTLNSSLDVGVHAGFADVTAETA